MYLRFLIQRRLWFLVFGLLFATLVATAATRKKTRRHRRAAPASVTLEQALEGSSTYYSSHVRPLLLGRCVRCHGPQRHSGGLRVDSVAAMLRGGESGPALVPGRASDSPLISQVVAHTMPKGGPPLSEEEIATLQKWVDRGAAAPNEEVAGPRRAHWAFQPLALPPVPQIPSDFVKNPVDAFVAARWQKAWLPRHNQSAEPRLLLRRLTIDLTGLPPTVAEYAAFLNDSSPEAYENAVDRLLGSPRYAERWARHWMDILRYSSPDGRYGKGGKGFKEITFGSQHIWRWRDYLIHAIDTDKGFNQVILEMLAGDELAPEDPQALAATGYLVRNFNCRDRDLWLTTTVDHTAEAFLGLSLGCARCHNHKFDPLSQKEYYQFRAFFEPYEVETKEDRELAYAKDGLPRPTYLLVRGNPHAPDKSKEIEPQVPEVLGKVASCQPVERKVQRQLWQSSGRRLALARWLVHDDNPLVARVIVNHVWLRHFGRGLVETPAEFGIRGQPPTHPELLDWLAVQFRTHQWSMKWLHRLIVTSSTYRMSSGQQNLALCQKLDPHNRLYWRAPSRRAEAEVVRDAILHLAGKLDNSVGGPDDDCAVADTSCRRSLYVRSSREERSLFLEIFDAARVEECYQRSESIVPQQGLALLNSEFVWRHAEQIAAGLRDRPDPIQSAFELLLARVPTAEEGSVCRQFLTEQEASLRAARVADPAQLAQTYLIHSLLNHNDFISIR